ncbi:hypothetical protein [Aquitalea sp. FJL05]|uniref:hypothetical protein n=1 Tax=Aquitalea sp. FJL05 TaxID=2153366 RepID=UPI000F591E43|nr:hypothetical protein [Aquitalea sp. FJL05]
MMFLLVGASQDEKQKAPSISGGALGIRASRSHTQSTPAVCGRGGGGGDAAKCHAFIMIVAVAGCQAAWRLPGGGVSALPMMYCPYLPGWRIIPKSLMPAVGSVIMRFVFSFCHALVFNS